MTRFSWAIHWENFRTPVTLQRNQADATVTSAAISLSFLSVVVLFGNGVGS